MQALKPREAMFPQLVLFVLTNLGLSRISSRGTSWGDLARD